MKIRKATILIVAGGIIVLGAVFLGALSRGSTASSQPDALNLPAVSSISAIQTDSNVVAVPAPLRNLPADVGPTSDTVHRLDGGIYAWISGDRVCSQDSNGNGGCFEKFERACNCRVADRDKLGEGEPVLITGIVPDGASLIEIVTETQKFDVPLSGNGFSFELPDTAVRPWDVTGAWVTLEDGTRSYVQLGSGVAPAGLK